MTASSVWSDLSVQLPLMREPREPAEWVRFLREELNRCLPRLRESNSYYEASVRLETIGIGTPPELRKLLSVFGWPRMYVEAIEERMDLNNFRLGGATEDVEELIQWWQANDLDEISGQVHIDAFVYGRAYVTVAADPDDPEAPRIIGESPLTMYAYVDPATGEVLAAARFYADPFYANLERCTLMLPNETLFFANKSVGRLPSDVAWVQEGPSIRHNLGQCPVVPIVNRARLGDPYGSSEIIPELRSVVDAASRTLMNLQAATETMAVPQRLIFGVDPADLGLPDPNSNDQAQQITDVYLSRILALENQEGKAFQFSAADLRNYLEVIEGLAKIAASYTGLPPQYLSFNSENPASAEAIRSAETRLVRKCERKSRGFGSQWERVMRLAMLVHNGSVPPEFSRLETVWANPATPTKAATADAVVKLYASGNGPIPLKYARMDLGYTPEQIADMEQLDREDPMKQLNRALKEQLLANAKEPDEDSPDLKQRPRVDDESDG